MEKSNLDVAFELVSKKKNPVAFAKLWEEVSQVQGLSEEEAKQKVGKFYTSLSLDGRFITLGDTLWDLRSRYPFEKVHIDMNEVYSDEVEEEEEKNEKEYFDEEDLDEGSEEESEDEEENEGEPSEEEQGDF